MKFIRKRNYWAFLPLFVLLRVALPVDANATTDWLTPWEEESPQKKSCCPKVITTLAGQLNLPRPLVT